MTVQRLYSGLDRIAGKGALRHVQHTVALFAQRIEAGANDAEIVGTFDGAEAARDLLFYLGHAYRPFGHVVGERYGEIANEQQNGVGMLAETP